MSRLWATYSPDDKRRLADRLRRDADELDNRKKAVYYRKQGAKLEDQAALEELRLRNARVYGQVERRHHGGIDGQTTDGDAGPG